MPGLSLNRTAFPLVRELLSEPEKYGIRVLKAECGATVLDLGVEAPGGLNAQV